MTQPAMPIEHPGKVLAALLADGPTSDVLSKVTGSAAHPRLQRVLVSSRRPLQLVYTQEKATVFAEHHGDACEAEAERLRASLAKSRRGLSGGLDGGAVLADPASGLVLRRPGLDTRLPGLRMLHDPDAARALIAAIEGQDPGPVTVSLMAHRLGKRAVLRCENADRQVRYARLRTDKSGSGQTAFARHQRLWAALKDDPLLRVPEPLGQSTEMGVALFAELPGTAPVLEGSEGVRACHAIGRALTRLQDLRLSDLPVHDGMAEAMLLRTWHSRLTTVFPTRAEAFVVAIDTVCPALVRHRFRAVPCHRDLHEKQVLMDGARAGLLDFDTLCLGHPAMDAGNLMAHLFLMGVTTGRRRAAVETAIVNAIRHVPERDLRLWRRAALLRLCMIYAFSDMSKGHQAALQAEALIPHD
jgi:hypothetical protein